MACLQNGTTLLNNNNLTAFKHNIMKYNETRSNSNEVWNSSPPINTFFTMNCQIPFRSNHTKDSIFSDAPFMEDASVSLEQHAAKRPVKETLKANSLSKVDGSESNYDLTKVCDSEARGACKKQGLLNALTEANAQARGRGGAEGSPLEYGNKLSVFHVSGSEQAEAEAEPPADHQPEPDSNEPSHHARRPMNAFLIFCKRHRTVVKNKYPHLENRAVTKILGEWWAGLETHEKASYTELAQQYKNAFFSANPNFKWYKLPAPPLRTLNTRPTNVVKSPSPKPPAEPEEKPQQLFTPGKLADETQLGSITSLIKSEMQYTNNAVAHKATPRPADSAERVDAAAAPPKHEYKEYLSPPCATVEKREPPKPFKKRMLYQHIDNKSIARSIFGAKLPDKASKKPDSTFDSSLLEQALESFVENVDKESAPQEAAPPKLERSTANNSNLTQQELINKVVDHMCSTSEPGDDKSGHDSDVCEEAGQREPRKSFRSCKGLRYAKFMAEGKLFVNKRTKKRISNPKLAKSLYANANDKVPRTTETIELNETIKKLAERTRAGKSLSAPQQPLDDGDEPEESEACPPMPATSRDEHMRKFFRAADFNLDEKIEALPSLSLEKFQQKKRENKKKKFLRASKVKESPEQPKEAAWKPEEKDDALTGSRKRKPRKQSITRLDPQLDKPTAAGAPAPADDMDLCGLATLAEVAAKKAKLDQK